MKIIKVIIPAYNEEHAIEHVIQEIPSYVAEIIVINNNSTDDTVAVAKKAGATVLSENKKGYGYACLKGLDYINTTPITPDIIIDRIKVIIKVICEITKGAFSFTCPALPPI